MTPTKVRSAAYRARKKVRDSDALVRLERYERALREIAQHVYAPSVVGIADEALKP